MISPGDYVVYSLGDQHPRTAKAVSGLVRNTKGRGYHYVLEVRRGWTPVQIECPAASVKPLPTVEAEEAAA